MTDTVRPVFLIGVGNSLRRDDGIGCAVAERLAAELAVRGVPVVWRCAHQLLPELAEEVADLGPCAVVIADAAVGVDAPHVARVEPGVPGPGLGHALGAGEFVLWVRDLYAVSAPVFQLRLPAVDFDHGEGFSPRAEAVLGVIPVVAGALLAALGLDGPP